MIGLMRSPASLQRAIAERVDAMLAAGLVDEMRGLVRSGYSYDLPAMSGIGYHEVGMHLRGEIDLATARELIIRNTRRFVRRQYQWFRLTDPAIHWFNLDEEDALSAVEADLISFGLQKEGSSS
jgi:tRNA dimethylallyltransferase